MRKGAFGVVGLALLATACGNSGEQRSASGGLSGAAIGALAGGPIGAIIGAGVGAGAGTATPESADTLAANALGKSGTSRQAVKDAQQKLADAGFYHGQSTDSWGRRPRCRDGTAARSSARAGCQFGKSGAGQHQPLGEGGASPSLSPRHAESGWISDGLWSGARRGSPGQR